MIVEENKMINARDNDVLINAINTITAKLSDELLQEFLNLPDEAQKNLVLIKTAQLLLANVLCQVSVDREELEVITNSQHGEIKELVFNCAVTGFSKKFGLINH